MIITTNASGGCGPPILVKKIPGLGKPGICKIHFRALSTTAAPGGKKGQLWLYDPALVEEKELWAAYYKKVLPSFIAECRESLSAAGSSSSSDEDSPLPRTSSLSELPLSSTVDSSVLPTEPTPVYEPPTLSREPGQYEVAERTSSLSDLPCVSNRDEIDNLENNEQPNTCMLQDLADAASQCEAASDIGTATDPVRRSGRKRKPSRKAVSLVDEH
jgi:hypothetical protein